jgi:tRNA threonylcarbamoyladenosine biosynthesis protein TsaB
MWLALETAGDRASVAVGETFEDAVEESLVGSRRHAGALLPMVTTALAGRGVALEAITGILVSDGPGSFTGLRVGASVGKALARARDLPLHTAPSLVVRAAGVPDRDGRLVLAVSDALRGDVYAAAVRFTRGRVRVELEPGVWRPEDLAALDLRPDVLVGEAPAPVMAELERWSRRLAVAPPAGAPRAVRLIELATLDGGARRVEDPQAWEPVYGRPAEAQARWETAHGRPLPDSVGGSR